MHNLLRCRRGSAAFATVAAMVPLIGVVALGGEAGSWYAPSNTRKTPPMLQPTRVPYGWDARSPESAIQHKTMSIVASNLPHGMRSATLATLYPCSNCATSLPAGTTQTVQIDQPTSSRVRAIVSQHQPGYLAAVLGLFPD